MEQLNRGYAEGRKLDEDQLDENLSWKDTLETLTSELEEAGVAVAQVRNAAAFLLAAYVQRLPLLLAGPSGKAMADALSAALEGCTAGELDASGNYDAQSWDEAEKSKGHIVCIRNIFAGNGLIPAMERLQDTGKYYVFVHPFKEDLLIEPRSLFDFVHPVFTDVLVEKTPGKDFIGGKNAPKYTAFVPGDTGHAVMDTELYPHGTFAGRRMEHTLQIAKEMLGTDSAELPYLYCYLPYCYVCGEKESLRKKMTQEKGLSKLTVNTMAQMLEP